MFPIDDECFAQQPIQAFCCRFEVKTTGSFSWYASSQIGGLTLPLSPFACSSSQVRLRFPTGDGSCVSHDQARCDLSVRFNCFSMFYATPVGQASNPGPDSEGIRLAICNPTAVHKKVDLLLNFHAQIIVASETSATSIIQKQVSSDLKSNGISIFLEPSGCTKKSHS